MEYDSARSKQKFRLVMWIKPRNPWLHFTDVKKDYDSYQWLLGGAQPVIPTNLYSADVYLYVYVNLYVYEHNSLRSPGKPTGNARTSLQNIAATRSLIPLKPQTFMPRYGDWRGLINLLLEESQYSVS